MVKPFIVYHFQLLYWNLNDLDSLMSTQALYKTKRGSKTIRAFRLVVTVLATSLHLRIFTVFIFTKPEGNTHVNIVTDFRK